MAELTFNKILSVYLRTNVRSTLITDMNTGLMWQKQGPESTKNWKDALSYCEDLSLADYRDWRLPNRKELRSVADYGKYNPATDTKFFLDTKTSYYWSSTTDANYTGNAWLMNFYSGYGHYEVHEAVNQPEAHNGVLIDGEGSWHVDAFAQDAGAGDGLQWASATTSFGGVDWQRSVALLGETGLLVVDRLAPSDGQAHDYTLVLHGPSVDFAMDAGLARWGAGDLELQLTVLGAPTTGWSPRAAQHGFTRTLEDHTALDVAVPDSGAVTLVTLALAVRDGDDALVSDGSTARWSQGSVTADGELDWRGESWSF